MLNWVKKIQFDESSPLTSQGHEHSFGFHKHKPEVMPHSHWHGHIEINYLFGCSADYLINGQKISVPEGRMLLFWASIPHQMIATEGDGYMVNVYIPLQAFLSWKFSNQFISQLLHGEVLVSDYLHHFDQPLTQMWQSDLTQNNHAVTAQVVNEIRGRIRRMSIEQYTSHNSANTLTCSDKKPLVSGLNHIQTMLLYIADNYDQKVTVQNVAAATGLHQNYAMKLFNRVMKISIKQYINQMRLQHAQALLIDTEDAVLNIALEAGFGSVSRFYDNFQREFEMTPLEYRNDILRQQS